MKLVLDITFSSDIEIGHMTSQFGAIQDEESGGVTQIEKFDDFKGELRVVNAPKLILPILQIL